MSLQIVQDSGSWQVARPIGVRVFNDHPVDIFLNRHLDSPRTLQAYKNELQALAEIAGNVDGGCYVSAYQVPWHRWRPQDFHALFKLRGLQPTAVGGQRAPSYQVICGAVIRGLARAMRTAKLIDGDTRDEICDLPTRDFETLPAGRSLERSEVTALYRVLCADRTPIGVRDGVILLALGVGGGLRRAEMCRLDVTNYDQAAGSVRVCGKRNKERMVWLDDGSRSWLDAWLEVRGAELAPLLVAVGKGGRVGSTRLTERSVFKICRRRAAEAGLAPFSPHDLRRSMVGLLMDAGADLNTIKNRAGHKLVSTTQRYDRRSDQVQREAAALLAIPSYRRPA